MAVKEPLDSVGGIVLSQLWIASISSLTSLSTEDRLTAIVLLHTINAFLPLLTHALQVGKIHPEGLYLTLARLVGELSTVSEDIDPKDVPPCVKHF